MNSLSPITGAAQLSAAIHSTLSIHANMLMPPYAHLVEGALQQPDPLVVLPHYWWMDDQTLTDTCAPSNSELPVDSFIKQHGLSTFQIELKRLKGVAESTNRALTEEKVLRHKYNQTSSDVLEASHKKGSINNGEQDTLNNESWMQLADRKIADRFLQAAILAAHTWHNSECNILLTVKNLRRSAILYGGAGFPSSAAMISESSALTIINADEDALFLDTAHDNLLAAISWRASLQHDQDPTYFDMRVLRAVENGLLAQECDSCSIKDSADQIIGQILASAAKVHAQNGREEKATVHLLYLMWRMTQVEEDPESVNWADVGNTLNAAAEIFSGNSKPETLIEQMRELAGAALLISETQPTLEIAGNWSA